MSIDEAVKLLTLHEHTIDRVQDLEEVEIFSKLFNSANISIMKRFYLFEWNESPQDSILNAQQKLHKHGLTAN